MLDKSIRELVFTYVQEPVSNSVSGKGKFLFWCDAAECQVWPVMIVGPQPTSGKFLDFVKRF